MVADPRDQQRSIKIDMIPSCCFAIFRYLSSDYFYLDSQSAVQEFPSYVQVLFFRLF